MGEKLRLLVVGVGLLAFPAAADAGPLIYRITPLSTDIDFSIGVLGVSTARGAFTQFSGTLALDLDSPENSTVEVDIDTRSADCDWLQMGGLVRSEDFLDVEHFPDMVFRSGRVTSIGANRIRLDGDLTLKGVTHRQSLVAILETRHRNPETAADEAVFAVEGELRRSDYGMTADNGWIAETVSMRIRARLVLPAPPDLAQTNIARAGIAEAELTPGVPVP